MEISPDKTKAMTNNLNGFQREIKIKGQRLEEVENFKYLGAIISNERSKPEILSRLKVVEPFPNFECFCLIATKHCWFASGHFLTVSRFAFHTGTLNSTKLVILSARIFQESDKPSLCNTLFLSAASNSREIFVKFPLKLFNLVNANLVFF